MKTIRWGMIGCGNVTEVKSGAPAINSTPNATLKMVMARKEQVAKDYAARHNVPLWTTNADALINHPDIDAVYIATPPDSHQAYAEKVILAGKPVYVEKPMARNAEECNAMNAVSDKTGVPLFVAYYRRTLPYFLKVKSLLEENAIGEVKVVQLSLHWPPYAEETGENAQPRWRVFPEISGGGHFHDLASHQFDLLEFLLGNINNAKGIALNQSGLYPADDVVAATFSFDDGITGTGNWCFTVPECLKQDSIEIIGSLGKIVFSSFAPNPIRCITADGTQEFSISYPKHVQQPLFETIVNELNGVGRCPSTGKTAAKASLILDWITRG